MNENEWKREDKVEIRGTRRKLSISQPTRERGLTNLTGGIGKLLNHVEVQRTNP